MSSGHRPAALGIFVIVASISEFPPANFVAGRFVIAIHRRRFVSAGFVGPNRKGGRRRSRARDRSKLKGNGGKEKKERERGKEWRARPSA